MQVGRGLSRTLTIGKEDRESMIRDRQKHNEKYGSKHIRKEKKRAKGKLTQKRAAKRNKE